MSSFCVYLTRLDPSTNWALHVLVSWAMQTDRQTETSCFLVKNLLSRKYGPRLWNQHIPQDSSYNVTVSHFYNILCTSRTFGARSTGWAKSNGFLCMGRDGGARGKLAEVLNIGCILWGAWLYTVHFICFLCVCVCGDLIYKLNPEQLTFTNTIVIVMTFS